MTEARPDPEEGRSDPEEGIADALTDLSGQTRALVRREIESAQTEMWAKVKKATPAAALLGLSAALGLAATASAYRLSLRVLERVLRPTGAALFAVLGYGGAAIWTGTIGIQRLRHASAPLPTTTVREASDTFRDITTQGRPAD